MVNSFLRFHIAVFLLLAWLTGDAWAERTRINVGGYLFAPYVNVQDDGRYYGLTLDFITLLNQLQTEYEFQFVATSVEQRYRAFSLKRFDMMMFENPNWGWHGTAVQFSPLNVHDGERFITLRTSKKRQEYFDSLKDKRLILVKGYHYQFANWVSEPDYLTRNFNVQFVNSNRASIDSIIRSRGDIAPITWSYLQNYLLHHPDARKKLFISDKWDQEYQHGILLRDTAALPLTTLSGYIKQLEQSGKLKKLLNQYGLVEHYADFDDDGHKESHR